MLIGSRGNSSETHSLNSINHDQHGNMCFTKPHVQYICTVLQVLWKTVAWQCVWLPADNSLLTCQNCQCTENPSQCINCSIKLIRTPPVMCCQRSKCKSPRQPSMKIYDFYAENCIHIKAVLEFSPFPNLAGIQLQTKLWWDFRIQPNLGKSAMLLTIRLDWHFWSKAYNSKLIKYFKQNKFRKWVVV